MSDISEVARMPIGVFSRASSISVRTLRAYHDSGLLVPAAVDPVNGYRSYAVDQLADALVIVRLRALDLPLAKVHEVLQCRDPAITAAVLDEHRGLIENRLQETQDILAALHGGVSATTTPVHVRQVEARAVLALTEDVPVERMWAWLEHATTLLTEAAGNHIVADEPPGALYGPAIENDDHEVVTSFVAIDRPFLVPATAHPVAVTERRSCEVAVLAHAGGFNTIGDSYRLLGAWVARNRRPDPAAPVREYYPCLSPTKANEPTIEIHWPITSG